VVDHLSPASRALAQRRVRGPAVSLALLALFLHGPAAVSQDWPTYRGDLRRSGSAGEIPGPRKPDVLWVFPGTNQYLAAPAPGEEAVFIPALGAFNTPLALALASAPQAGERVVWSRRAPALRLPPAASPVVAAGVVYFGEGMHQNEAGAVSAFSAADGLPLWRLEVSGELHHVEGSPALAGGRLYFGCGSGGIFCVDPGRVELEGRELALADAERLLRKRWDELAAAYEAEKKKDPDFAVPPSAADLPAGRVKTIWNAGADRWHVDAPLAVSGERVLAGSAYLDEEKVGDRALICLAAADGALIWRVPLEHNPWGSPSLARGPGGRTAVLAGSSSIRYDPALVGEARGEVLAVDLESGERFWSIAVRGGVLSPVAVDAGGTTGVFTSTDGAVRAVNTASGEVIWSSAAGTPYFAAVSLAGGRAFAVDLDGTLRALEMAGGKEAWRLDLAAHPKVGMPGRVYASPLCAAGRIFVATCNLEGPHAGEPTAVICIGEEEAPEEAERGLAIDAARGRVIIDAVIAPRKLPHLERIYPIEVLATSPQGKKAHETVIATTVRPSSVHRALESLGLSPGRPGVGAARGRGPEVRLLIEFTGPGGRRKELDAARAVIDRRTGLPLGRSVRWHFTGSIPVRPDPTGEEEVYGADFSGTLATFYPVTAETVLQSNLTMDDEVLLDLEVGPRLPPVSSPAKLVIEVPRAPRSPGEE
jgi:outer membrane protein assembly factor BamB